jgi:hypothetical protein
MRVKTIRFSFELLADLFSNGEHGPHSYSVEQGIPADAKLVNVRHGWPNPVEMVISSEEFPEIKDGEEIGELSPVVTSKA